MKITSLSFLAILISSSVSVAETVLLDESFDGLSGSLQPAVTESIPASILGWTHTSPTGWHIDNSKMPPRQGMTEWQGWSFTTLEFWTGADSQDRGRFDLSSGVLAVADPDEWDDLNTPSSSGWFDSTLISPPVPVRAHQVLYLSFDSHYRQEAPQEAQILVSFDGQPDSTLLHYSSNSASDNKGQDVQNKKVVLTLPVPEKDGNMVLKWRLFNAGNNWFWAIDNVKVSDEKPLVPIDPNEAPEPDPILAKGPFVQFLSPHSVRILWETIKPGSSILEYGISQLDGRIEDATPVIRHEAILTGLQADMEYVYVIKSRIEGMDYYGGTYTFDSTFDDGPGAFPLVDSPFPADALTAFYETAAETIVRETGADKGFCLVLGFERGRLAFEIARRTNMRIVGIEDDPEKIAYARTRLRSAGIYGNRISVQQGSLTELPYGDYFANLIVSDRLLLTGTPVGSASEVLRVLRPYGGAILLGQPASAPQSLDRAALENWMKPVFSGEMEKKDSAGGFWVQAVRGALPNAGEWTHQYAEPGNSACSGDQIVQAPVRVLWYGRPGPRLIVNRHSRPMAPLFKNGRVFIPANDRIIALDAYNGSRLWDLGVPGSRRMGAFKGSAPMVAAEDCVYIAQGRQSVVVDMVTGLPVHALETPSLPGEEPLDWGYTACVGDRIVGSAHPRGTPFYEYSNNGNCDELEEDGRACMISNFIFSYNRRSGELQWTYRDGAILETTIAIGEGRVYFAENRRLPPPTGEWEKAGRRWVGHFTSGVHTYLVAIDLETGQKLWEKQVRLPFTEMMYLSYSSGSLFTVGSYNKAGDCRYAVYAFDAESGRNKWNDDYDSGSDPNGSHGEQWQHPVIIKDNIFSRPYFYDMETGVRQNFQLGLGGKCGTYSATPNYLFARDSNPCYYVYGDPRPKSNPLSNVTRPGCFINIIPVGGLVLLPESSSGCTCEYPIQTSMAFIAR